MLFSFHSSSSSLSLFLRCQDHLDECHEDSVYSATSLAVRFNNQIGADKCLKPVLVNYLLFGAGASWHQEVCDQASKPPSL